MELKKVLMDIDGNLKPKRVFVVGDIHGAAKALKQALNRANFNIKEDQLISLGDCVDGWGESPQVIDILLKIQEEAIFKPIFIRGNHDAWAQEWLEFGNAQHIWINQGGRATKEAYENMNLYTDFDIDKHRKFFKNQVNYYIDDQNRGFCHGGFVSKKGLGHEVHQTNYYWDRDLWQIALGAHSTYVEGINDEDIAYIPRYKKHKEIFIGHTTTNAWNCKPHYPEFNNPDQESKNGPIVVPMKRCNVWNLDTGGGFKGKVTVMNVDTHEYFQSNFVPTLYPNELGRR